MWSRYSDLDVIIRHECLLFFLWRYVPKWYMASSTTQVISFIHIRRGATHFQLRIPMVSTSSSSSIIHLFLGLLLCLQLTAYHLVNLFEFSVRIFQHTCSEHLIACDITNLTVSYFSFNVCNSTFILIIHERSWSCIDPNAFLTAFFLNFLSILKIYYVWFMSSCYTLRFFLS